MLVQVGKEFFEIPFLSMEAMLRQYDNMNVDTKDRANFLRVTELVSMDRASRDGREAVADAFDPYRPTRYKRCLRAVLRRRGSSKSKKTEDGSSGIHVKKIKMTRAQEDQRSLPFGVGLG